ncbi:MAG: Ger(x)C family spore germination protein [Clostridiales bacterium]|nr:Ger(x)C family spore germination protein [Clostridiales bacterium]
MKKVFAICAVFLLTLGLAGCDNNYGNDGREIRDRLIVQGIGVDQTADGGYLLTLQAFNTAVSGGQDNGMSGNVTKVYETSGATIADAMRNVTLTAGRRPLYSHNWIIVFGAEVAREGLNETLDFFVRDYATRPMVDLAVARGKAADIIKSPFNGSSIPAREIQMGLKMGQVNAKTLQMPLHKAVTLLEDKTSDVYLPLLKPVVDKAQDMDTVLLDGLAIFREGKYVGDLDADETRALLFLTGQAESGDLVVEGEPFGKASLELIKADAKFKTEMKNGLPAYRAEITCVCDLNEIEREDFGNVQSNVRAQIEAAVSAMLESQLRGTAEICLKSYRSDVLRLGNRLWLSEPNAFRSVEDRWREVLPKAELTVAVKTTVRRTGQKSAD